MTTSGVTPSARLDSEKIRELICNLNWLSDDGRLDDLLAQFTDELAYEIEGMALLHDKPSLRAFYEQVFRSFTMRIHRTSNEIIEVFGDNARSKCYWRADLIRNDVALVSAGRYFDEFVCVNNIWKIRSRRATMSYLSPLDEGWARSRYFNLAL
jgi:SnoaL-like domain